MSDFANPFHGIDVRSTDIEELAERLTPVITGLEIMGTVLEPGTRLFRARLVNGRVGNIAEVGMPEACYVKKPNRLNDIGEQVGYFSLSPRACYFEVHPSPGDYLVLSRWICQSQFTLLHLGYHQDVFFRVESSRSGEEYACVRETRQRSEHNQAIYDFLSRELTKVVQQGNEWEYKTTIAIGKKMLGNGPHDGLLYPTVGMRANADNVVLRKTSVSKLRLATVEYNRVVKTNQMEMGIEYIDSAVVWDEKGTIDWNGRRLRWSLDPGQLARAEAKEGGYCGWMLYDMEGNEIPPE